MSIRGMKRRAFIAALGGAAAWPVVGRAQQPGKVWRIGYLAEAPRPTDDVFRQAMRELGYVEGRNLTIFYRWGESGKYGPLAEDLVRLNVDLIVAVASGAAHAAKDATKTIPIVITQVGDPVAYGLVAREIERVADGLGRHRREPQVAVRNDLHPQPEVQPEPRLTRKRARALHQRHGLAEIQGGRTSALLAAATVLEVRLVVEMLLFVRLCCCSGSHSRASPLPSLDTETRTWPPLASRPNSSSSASGRLMCSWIVRAMGRAPIFGS